MQMSSKWSVEEQANFLRLIGELLDRGYPLSEAIESLKIQKAKRNEDLQLFLQYLKEGYSFSNILSKLHFNENLIGYVFFAEKHGGIALALKDSSSVTLKRKRDMDKLLKLLSYPFLLFIITTLLFTVIERLLLPQFTTLFQSMQLESNLFTKVIISTANILPLILTFLFIIIVLIIIYVVFYFRKYSALKQKELIIKIPLFGAFFRLLYTHFFSAQLSYLLSGGLSINEALQLFEKHHEQPFYQQIGVEIKRKLVMGEKLTLILRSFPYFEKDLVNIVMHGQKNGRLDKELYFYSRHCLERLEDKTERWLKIIQPMLFLIIGMLIISMYLAILLPMFKILDGF